MKRLKEKIKKHFQEVLEIKTSPSSIATGFAIGTFFGIAPTFGIESVLILLIILIFKKVSKVSLFAGYILWNPLVEIPLYALGYKIGDFLLKDVPAKVYEWGWLNQLFFYSRRLLVGAFILAFVISVISYFIIFYIAKKHKRKLEKSLKS